MSNKLKADIRQVERLGEEYAKAAEVGVRRVVERTAQIVREEVPKATTNLQQGVSSDVQVKRTGLILGEIIVSARSGRRARGKATLHLPSGKTKSVNLRAQPAHNYAEDVDVGTGEFGPKGVAITPKKARVLLVPVGGVPTLNGKPEAYIDSDGQIFVMRRSVKGRKPNRYSQRSQKRIESEAPAIFDRALKDFVGGKP